jgi:glucose-1-phosphate cytidylyltransferase
MWVDGERVSCFTEKPQVSEGSVNGGFFVFDAARIWNYVPDEPGTILERGPLQHLADEGELAAFRHPGFWQPMDTPREFRELNELWETGQAPWKVWQSSSDKPARDAKSGSRLRLSTPPRRTVEK